MSDAGSAASRGAASASAAGPSATTRRWRSPSSTSDGTPLRASARFCALVGRLGQANWRASPLQSLLHEEDRAPHAPRPRRAGCRRRAPYRRDERYVRPDGTVVWATNEIDRAADGRLLVVAQTSAALLARAEAARERAEADVRRRDEFLSVLSHELRSPLAAILVWARLLRDSDYEEVDSQRGLEVIERSGRSLERILEDLVHVSRISSGKLQLTGRCDARPAHGGAGRRRRAARGGGG